MDVGQEHGLGGPRGVRELRLEVGEDVEVGLQRVADVGVALVAARPEERLAARDVLDVVGDHAAVVQHRVLGLAEVVAHGTDHARLGQERGGQREMHGRAAEQAVAPAGRRLDGVEGDRTHHGQRHRGGRVAGSLRSPCARSASASGAGPRCSSSSRTPRCLSPARTRIWCASRTPGINFADTHASDNSYLAPYELPLTPGAEVAGTTEDGKRVAGLIATGGYAEFAAVPKATAFAIPFGVSDAPGARPAHPGPDRLAPVPHLGPLGRGRERGRARRGGRRRLARRAARQGVRRTRHRHRLDRGEAARSRSSWAPTRRSTSRART